MNESRLLFNETPAKLLAEAKRAAGERSVRSAESGNHYRSREWSALAVRIDLTMREAVRLMRDE